MASVGASFDTAITGLQKGIDQARKAGAQLATHTETLKASTDSSSGKSGEELLEIAQVSLLIIVQVYQVPCCSHSQCLID